MNFSRTVPMGADARSLLSSSSSAELAATAATQAVQLPQRALDEQLGMVQAAPRYHNQEFLGLGATGAVYSIEDRNLARVVAVKVLSGTHEDREQVGHFVHEARIIASLAHPNVLPIFDLDVASDGRVYFTMPRIRGRSLGAVIEASRAGARERCIAQAADVARIGVAVAQALACAHHQRIIHQDVKPDNIMLGDFGEMLLVDWGSAARLQPETKAVIYGTPLYMSPEQARCERSDERSDIYGLGAALFHALLLRVPTWSDDPDEFWRRKRSGEIKEPTREECARHPRVFLDILRKCLAADASARYQDAGALLADLHAYQNGLAVSAHRETALERVRRLHRLHGRAFWIWTGVLALASAVVLILYGERLEEMARWGRPIISEDFAAPRGPEWKLIDGDFEAKAGWLVSIGGADNKLLLDRRLQGAIAIEYDGEMLPGGRPCDISLGWCRDRTLTSDGRRVASLVDQYQLQVGGFDNSGIRIDNDTGTLAFSPLQLETGRVYRVRAEIEDDRMSLWVDGARQCTWQDPFPFQGGYFFLYGHYPLKAFRNVRVYVRGVAQKIPATGVGDAFAARGDYGTAAEEYAQVVESHPGTALGEEARYREGLCFWRLHREDQAMSVWRPLRAGPLGDRVRLHDIDIAFARGDHAATCSDIARLWSVADAEIRTGLALSWARYVNQLRNGHERLALLPYLDLHDRLMIGEHEVDGADADALLEARRYQEVLDRYPDSRYECMQALNGLGRFNEVIRDFPDSGWFVNLASLLGGRFEQVGPSWSFLRSRALLLQGRFQEAHDYPVQGWGAGARALMAMGKFEQCIAENPQDGMAIAECRLFMGRAAEIAPSYAYVRELVAGDAAKAVEACPKESTMAMVARWRLALDAWIAGDRHPFGGLEEADLQFEQDNQVVLAFYVWAMRPFLLELGGDHGALERACAHVIADHAWVFEQRPCFDARLLSGLIDADRYLAQPAPIYARARLQLLQAMRAELAGDRPAACDHYRSWQEIPAWERGEYPDPVLIRFVAWRLSSLGNAVASPAPPAAPHS